MDMSLVTTMGKAIIKGKKYKEQVEAYNDRINRQNAKINKKTKGKQKK